MLLLVKAALLIGYLKYEQWIIAELIEMTEKTFLMFPMVIFYHNLTGTSSTPRPYPDWVASQTLP